MKKILLTLVASTFILTGCSSSTSAVETVDATTWIEKAQSTSAQIIDVRTADEYASGHLANAINIDVEGGTFDSQIVSLDKNATYALYCHSGRRSNIAAGKMADAGFKNIINLNGGLTDLLQAGAQLG